MRQQLNFLLFGMSSRSKKGATPPQSIMPVNFNQRGGIGGASLRARTNMLGGSLAGIEPPWLKLAFSRDDAETFLERFAASVLSMKILSSLCRKHSRPQAAHWLIRRPQLLPG
jgi:hypothetical protein